MLRKNWYLLKLGAAIMLYEHNPMSWLGRVGCAGGNTAPPGPKQQSLCVCLRDAMSAPAAWLLPSQSTSPVKSLR